MQKLAYDVVKQNFENVSSEKDQLCLTGVAGTGKSYLITAIRSLLQDKCSYSNNCMVKLPSISEV